MRLAVLITLFAVGCSVPVEQPETEQPPQVKSDAAPLVCAPPSGAYEAHWTLKSGDCGEIADAIVPAPGFNCNAAPLSVTASADKCEFGGDIECANGITTLVCTSADGKTLNCDAHVTRYECSGVYELTLTPVSASPTR